MKWFKPTLVMVCMLGLVGCLDNTGTDHRVITEPGGKANFNIINQTDANLTVTYTRTDSYTGRDSTIAVPADTTTKIFDAIGNGFTPYPSNAFAHLRFYDQSADTSPARLTIEPVVDEHWEQHTGSDGKRTVAKWDLTITKEDLK